MGDLLTSLPLFPKYLDHHLWEEFFFPFVFSGKYPFIGKSPSLFCTLVIKNAAVIVVFGKILFQLVIFFFYCCVLTKRDWGRE